jgi:hypothetical protein
MIQLIMYLVTTSQPDLTLAISFLSQFPSTPNKEHVVPAKSCLRYIKGTLLLTLGFPYRVQIFIPRFSNSDYGNCIESI